jgi:mannosyltransferase OCH1-like enzyme
MTGMPIPTCIHLIYADKALPARYAFYAHRMRFLHPGWEVCVWDDAAALAVVNQHFPAFGEMYSSYKAPVQRADIFRVLIVYLMGGFYMDLDMLCFRSLDELCKEELVLGIEKTLPESECARLDHRHSVRIANYMFGSRPRHPFWLDFLAAARVRSKDPVVSESDILETTGPGLLTNVFHAVKERYQEITLLPNTHRACLKSCGEASCHFGDFAVHIHMGSWRWETNLNQNCPVA